MTRSKLKEDPGTIRLSASELRKDLSMALNRVAFRGERIILERNNKDIAVLISIEAKWGARTWSERND